MRYNTLADIIKAEDTFEVETGIKSKDRVKKSGEVYTPDWVVNDMLNLVPTKDREDQTGVDNEERVISLDETYLEPACGNGNFLIRIIDRKLNRAVELGEQDLYKNVLKAYMSTYGVDIMSDNVEESKARMLLRLGRNKKLVEMLNNIDADKLVHNINFVLDRNIIWGNMLSGKVQIDDATDGKSEMKFVGWDIQGATLNTVICPACKLGETGWDSPWFGVDYRSDLEIVGLENGVMPDGTIDDSFDGFDGLDMI